MRKLTKLRSNKIKRLISPPAALLILTAAAAISVPLMLPAAADARPANTPKEEVVYVGLDPDGSVNDISVVNIFRPDKTGHITDYGNYDSVRNMTTSDEISQSGDVISIDTSSADKLYYEGKLTKAEIPWDFSFRYYLNGQELTAEQLAGQSGDLKITLDITENEKYNGSFFDDMALQVTLTMDSGKCADIRAEGATAANAGQNKQLTYTILPGKEADYTIEAKVKDFTMDSIQINGIPLTLDIDTDDAELTGEIGRLISAIIALDEGAEALSQGTDELQDNVSDQLVPAAAALADGTESLQAGAEALNSGGSGLRDGASKLQNGAAALDEGMRSLDSGIGQIQTAIDTLQESSDALTGGSAEFKEALASLQNAVDSLEVSAQSAESFVSASAEIMKQIDALNTGAAELAAKISSDAYKEAMSAQGLDVDGLISDDQNAASSLSEQKAKLDAQIAELSAAGIDTSDLEELSARLSDVITLLGSSAGALAGAEGYLDEVHSAVASLQEGTASLLQYYDQFNDSVAAIAGDIKAAADALPLLQNAIDSLSESYAPLDEGIREYTAALADIAGGFDQIAEGSAAMSAGAGQLNESSQALYAGSSELLSGLTDLYSVSGLLNEGSSALNDGTEELLEAIIKLSDGSREMYNGTSALRDETSDMEQSVADQINRLLQSVTGGERELSSFVSADNTNIESVQFVIKTPSITIDEETPAEEPAQEEQTFWQKLSAVLGF